MRWKVGFAVVILFAVTAATVRAQAPAPTPTFDVTLQGLFVMKPRSDVVDPKPGWGGWGAYGTTLDFRVNAHNARIIALDFVHSKLVSLSDDLGNDLTILGEPKKPKVNLLRKVRGLPPRERKRRNWLSSGGPMNRDNKSWKVLVGGVATPGEGAMAVELDAELVFLCGLNRKTLTVKDLAVKAGTQVDLGIVKATVIDFDKRRGNRKGIVLHYVDTGGDTLVWNQVASCRFMRADGTEITQRGGGCSRSYVNGKREAKRRFYMDEQPKTVTIKITYYETWRRLKVPVHIETGVGF